MVFLLQSITFCDPNNQHTITIFGMEYSWSVLIAAVILTVCVGLVVIGGLKRIATVSQVVGPAMAILYVVFFVLVLIFNVTKIPNAIVTIVESAFGLRAAAGGILGAIPLLGSLGIAIGYAVIVGWVLRYCVGALTGSLFEMDAE